MLALSSPSASSEVPVRQAILKNAALITAALIAVESPAFAADLTVNVPNAPGEIILNGTPTGVLAPGTVQAVPGQNMVELFYGCMAGGAMVDVPAEGTTFDLPVVYTPGKGKLRVRDLPEGAAVFVDDAPTEGVEAGVDMRCGGHRVSIEASGYETFQAMAMVTTDKWATVDASGMTRKAAPLPMAMYDPDAEDDDGGAVGNVDEYAAAAAAGRGPREPNFPIKVVGTTALGLAAVGGVWLGTYSAQLAGPWQANADLVAAANGDADPFAVSFARQASQWRTTMWLGYGLAGAAVVGGAALVAFGPDRVAYVGYTGHF